MPGKIYDLSDLDNLELPQIPSQAAKKAEAEKAAAEKAAAEKAAATAAPAQEAQAPAAVNRAAPVDPLAVTGEAAAGDFELPPLPVKKLAKAETPDNAANADTANGTMADESAADNSAANYSSADNAPVQQSPESGAAGAFAANAADDFDLPPLPVRKPDKPTADNSASDNSTPYNPTADSSAAAIANNTAGAADDFDLPPLPVKKAAPPEPETPADESASYSADNISEEAASDGFDLPPLPERVPEAGSENAENSEAVPDEEEQVIYNPAPEPEPEPEPAPRKEKTAPRNEKPAPRISLEDNPELNLDNVTPEDIGITDPSKALAPMRTAKDAKAKNALEKMKMDELAMNMEAPVLDDLSDEYAAPEKRADDLLERDYLESDEKQVLKQRLHEDLGRRPENFNARASRNMYNKLMEEKKLKIAKKGMMLSFIPIVMQLIAAGLCYLTMNWGNYQWFQYVAIFGVASAVLLLIKSKHTKMFSIIITAMTVLMYVGPGLVLYALDEKMQAADDYIVHVVCAAAAALLNVGAILILTKNEPINIYYTTKFKKK